MKRCRNGTHSLIEIYSVSVDHIADDVVRWCEYCGGVVVDREYDGRLDPGAVSAMRFPQVVMQMTLRGAARRAAGEEQG